MVPLISLIASHRLLGRALDAGNLLADLTGGLRGLLGERLHFRRHDRKAAAGFAGARRLDGGVERQKIGLARDGVDQFDDVADAGGCLRQFADAVVGRARLFDGFARHPGQFLDLTADLVDRGGKFFRRRSNRLDVGRGFLGCARHHGGQLLRTFGGRRQRAGGRFEFGRSGRHGLDDLADRGLEAVGELRHVRLALEGDAFFGVLLLFAIEAEFGLHGLHVSQRDADLVVPLDADAAVEQALRDPCHRRVELFERSSDGADGLKAQPSSEQKAKGQHGQRDAAADRKFTLTGTKQGLQGNDHHESRLHRDEGNQPRLERSGEDRETIRERTLPDYAGGNRVLLGFLGT